MDVPGLRDRLEAVVHPGELVREILRGAGLSVAEAARRMGVGSQGLYQLIWCQTSVKADWALRLSRLTGSAPELFLDMQNKWDIHHLLIAYGDELDKIKPIGQISGQ